MSVTGKTRASRQANATNIAVGQQQSDTSLQIAQMQIDAAERAAQLQQEGALSAAEISAGGAVNAAGHIAGATAYAAELGFEAQAQALAAQQQNYDASLERLQPYAEAGLEALPSFTEASTFDGFFNQLEQISNFDATQDLIADRQQAASNVFAQSGLTRSGARGRAAAEIPTDVALGLSREIYGRQANQVAIGQSAAAGQNYTGANFANNVSNINTSTAANIGGLTVQGAGQAANIFANASGQQAGIVNNAAINQGNLVQQGAYYAGQGLQSSTDAITGAQLANAQNAQQLAQNRTRTALAAGATVAANWSSITSAATYLAGFFSDERLKENMEPVGKIGPLTLYEWDWKDFMKGIIGAEMDTGFAASEVKKYYPDCVVEQNGVLSILYDKLHNILHSELQGVAA